MALTAGLLLLYFSFAFGVADHLNDPRSGMANRSIEFKLIACLGWPVTLLIAFGLIVWDAHRARHARQH